MMQAEAKSIEQQLGRIYCLLCGKFWVLHDEDGECPKDEDKGESQ